MPGDKFVFLTGLAEGKLDTMMMMEVGQEHEMSSKQIMDTLELCQSAASRHLKQLSATGYLNERRQNSAKIYSLNTSFISKTFDAVSDYLLKG